MIMTDDGGATAAAASGGERAEQLQSAVEGLRIRGASTRVEQQLKLGGAGLMVVGLVLIVAAYIGASPATATLQAQIDYMISGAMLGLGLLAVGAAVYLRSWMARQRYWLARIALDNDRHHEELLDALGKLAPRSGAGATPAREAPAGGPQRAQGARVEAG